MREEETATELAAYEMLSVLSNDFLCVFRISMSLKIYIYRFGIAVFTVEDEHTDFEKKNYAVEHCQARRSAHEEFLALKNDVSNLQRICQLNDGNLPEKLFLVGVDADCCVLKTAIDLFENNIRPVVLTSYCDSNGGPQSHNAGITWVISSFKFASA